MKLWKRYAITIVIVLAVVYFLVPFINKLKTKTTTS